MSVRLFCHFPTRFRFLPKNYSILKTTPFLIQNICNFSSQNVIPSPEVTPLPFSVKEIRIEGIPKAGDVIAGRLWTRANNDKEQTTIPVVSLHGWLDNCASFDPLVERLIQRDTRYNFSFLTLDLPGHGFSTSGSFSTLLYDPFLEVNVLLQRILKYFGWNKIILLSHSLGAILGFIFTSVYPEHVRALISLDNLHPPPSSDYIKATRHTLKVLFDVEEKLAKGKPPQYTYDQMLEKLIKARDNTISEEGCKTLLTRGATPVPGSPGKYIWSHDLRSLVPTALGRFTSDQCRDFAKRIQCPVCIIKGEPGADYEPRANFMEVFELLKVNNESSVDFHSVEGSHHFHLNTPELVAPIIGQFLDSLPSD